MAFRGPRFMYHHSARVGLASLVGSTEATGFPRERIGDNSIRRLARWNATTGTQWIGWDGEAGHVDIDRLLIPSGHNLSGETVTVRSHTSTFTAETDGTLRHSFTAAAGLIDEEFTAITDRYLAITATAGGSQRDLAEAVLTETRTDTPGPDPGWRDEYLPNQVETELSSGATFRRARGAAKRRFAFNWHGMSGTDLAVFTDMRTETETGLYPVWVDPPEDTTSPEDAIPMRIIRLELTQDYPIPMASIEYSVQLELEEVIS